MKGKSKKRKVIKHKVIKIKKVPKEVIQLVEEGKVHKLPEPIKELVLAIHQQKIEALHLHPDVEPTTWEKFKNWFSGE